MFLEKRLIAPLGGLSPCESPSATPQMGGSNPVKPECCRSPSADQRAGWPRLARVMTLASLASCSRLGGVASDGGAVFGQKAHGHPETRERRTEGLVGQRRAGHGRRSWDRRGN